jgi:hypothetical protein
MPWPRPSRWRDSLSREPGERKARAPVVRRSTRAHFQPSKESGIKEYIPPLTSISSFEMEGYGQSDCRCGGNPWRRLAKLSS